MGFAFNLRRFTSLFREALQRFLHGPPRRRGSGDAGVMTKRMDRLPYKTARDRFRFASLTIMLLIGLTMLSGGHALAEPLGTGIAKDPASKSFGMTDPVTSSMQATENLGSRLLEQQHRFQANANRRQMRPKRPEPGEVEVTREEEAAIPSDPLRNTLRNILPRDR
jgi:hypothetical protein